MNKSYHAVYSFLPSLQTADTISVNSSVDENLGIESALSKKPRDAPLFFGILIKSPVIRLAVTELLFIHSMLFQAAFFAGRRYRSTFLQSRPHGFNFNTQVRQVNRVGTVLLLLLGSSGQDAAAQYPPLTIPLLCWQALRLI